MTLRRAVALLILFVQCSLLFRRLLDARLAGQTVLDSLEGSDLGVRLRF